MSSIVLIPAYKPDLRLVSLVQNLSNVNQLKILVVNNGNIKDFDPYFKKILKFKNVSVMKIKNNFGKGYGLKKGLYYIINNFENIDNIIFADADGQHIEKDIISIRQRIETEKHDNIFLIGNRLHNNLTPYKNLFANKFFNYFFKKKLNLNIQDSLCGLRAIKFNYAKYIAELKYNDFRFEVEMIIYLKKNHYKLIEENISSIYFQGNKSTLSILDSLKLLNILFFFKK